MTITVCGTAEGVQEYKFALWKKVEGGAQYVDGSTGYIHTDGSNYRFTITGLDPAAPDPHTHPTLPTRHLV